LLAGLIEDGEGNRFTSSFTVKSGRRYRYYVSRPAEKSGSGESKEWARVPAHEVESRVMEKFREFLKSDTDLIDGAAETGEGPATLAPLVTAAKKLAARSSIHSTDLRALIILLFQRVVIRESQIQIEIWRARLREILENGNEINSDHLAGVQKSTDSSDIIYLTIEAKRKRYGGEIHLVIPPSSGVPVRHPRPALIKAVVRGHAWHRKVLDGEVADMRSLALQVGLTPHYVRNVFTCAFLAPDIVEAILEGRQPLALKFAHLYKEIPLLD
jgi:hypothetical protein